MRAKRVTNLDVKALLLLKTILYSFRNWELIGKAEIDLPFRGTDQGRVGEILGGVTENR